MTTIGPIPFEMWHDATAQHNIDRIEANARANPMVASDKVLMLVGRCRALDDALRRLLNTNLNADLLREINRARAVLCFGPIESDTEKLARLEEEVTGLRAVNAMLAGILVDRGINPENAA